MAFNDILTRMYYGNSIQEWSIALLIVLAFVILGRLLYWIFGNIIKKITKKTKTKLDDIIIDMIEEPVVFSIVILGLWYALKTLTLSEKGLVWVSNIFQVLIAITVTWLVARLFDSLYKEYLIPLAGKTDTDLDDQLVPIVRKGTKAIIWILGIVVALNNAGYNVGALLAGLGIGGLAFAMAAKDLLANIFGGIMIYMDRPFKLRDRIKIVGFDGNVKEIGLRSTRIKTLEGRLVTIPNSKFMDNPVENVTKEPTRKVVLKLGLIYDTSPAKINLAMKILKDIARKNENLDEKVLLSFNNWGDFSLGILFIYYIKKSADILGTQTEINLEILKQFNKNKLEFAFPTQTMYTKKS